MIENWASALTEGRRADLARIFGAALQRADPLRLMSRCLSLKGEELVIDSGATQWRRDLREFRRIVLLGFGKASARMALALERLLGDRIEGGVVITKRGHGEKLSRVELLEAAHPIPDASSEGAARRLLAVARDTNENDLVINCISGGGSSLLCAPAPGLSLEDKRELYTALLASGLPIEAVNCVRKHISAVKGGRLAEALYPATSVNLILSDVIGDDLSSIASGPTVPDPSTWQDAAAILADSGMMAGLTPALRRVFDEGTAGLRPETSKPGDAIFEPCTNLLVGTNRLSLAAASDAAERLGYATLVLTSRLQGEARELSRLFVALALDIETEGIPLSAPACILAGGESTVTLRGKGTGGRNQEMALAFLDAANDAGLDLSRVAFLSGATDGNDGPTDAAGGIVDAATRRGAAEARLRTKTALAANDSYAFLKAAGGLLVTGPTNTNVCDIQVLVVGADSARAGPET